MKEKTKKRLKYFLNVILLIAILSGTLYFLLHNQEIDDILRIIHDAKAGYLLAGIGFIVIFVTAEAAVMHKLLNSFSNTISFMKCVGLSCCGFFYSSITPGASGGQPVQIFYMTKYKVDVLVGTLTCMIITIFYKAVLLLLCLIFLIVNPGLMTEAIGRVPLLFTYGVLGNSLFLCFLLLAVFKPSIAYSILASLIKLGGRLRILKHPERTLEKAMSSIKQYERGAEYFKHHLSMLPRLFIITFVQRIIFFCVCFMVYKSFGLGGTSIFDFIALQVVLALAVDVLPLPGAAGANESVFVILFKKIFGGVAVLSGLLLYRGITYYILLIVTGIITFIMHIAMMRSTKKEPANEKMEVNKC